MQMNPDNLALLPAVRASFDRAEHAAQRDEAFGALRDAFVSACEQKAPVALLTRTTDERGRMTTKPVSLGSVLDSWLCGPGERGHELLHLLSNCSLFSKEARELLRSIGEDYADTYVDDQMEEA